MRGKITQTADRLAIAVVDRVSKNGLIDLVVDLIRREKGDEHLDGEDLARAFSEVYAPIASARRERLPTVEGVRRSWRNWDAKREEWARTQREDIRRADALADDLERKIDSERKTE